MVDYQTAATDIPDMTDPMGKYWAQPERSQIIFDNVNGAAIMSEGTYNQLAAYNHTYHKRLNRWSGHATLMVEDYSITVETPMCATIDAAVGSLKDWVVEAYLKFNKDDQQQPTV